LFVIRDIVTEFGRVRTQMLPFWCNEPWPGIGLSVPPKRCPDRRHPSHAVGVAAL